MGKALVVSDFHMGIGPRNADGTPNCHEDFYRDEEFIEFLIHHSTGRYSSLPVNLVINGDFIDVLFDGNQSLKCHRKPTAQDVQHRINDVLKGHSDIFQAMKSFASTSNHNIHLVVGNHDPDLLLPGVQECLRETIGSSLYFHPDHFCLGDLYVEHGHMFDVVNRHDPEAIWVGEGGDAILNMSIGYFLCQQLLSGMKEMRPLVHKIKPVGNYVRWCLAHDLPFSMRSLAMVFGMTMRTLFGQDKALANRMFELIRQQKILRIDRFLLYESYAKTLLRLEPYQTVVFGHTHRPVNLELENGKRYLNTGTWSELLRIEGKDLVIDENLYYASIELSDDRCQESSLRNWAA